MADVAPANAPAGGRGGRGGFGRGRGRGRRGGRGGRRGGPRGGAKPEEKAVSQVGRVGNTCERSFIVCDLQKKDDLLKII